MIVLGERIKDMRLRSGRTQENIADELGVTAQAVSRWEKGVCCPDMELIPSIANLFGVSIDELFGYDNLRSKKIDALYDRILDMNSRNNGADFDIDDCIDLARASLIEFPGNAKLCCALASVLYNAGYVRHGEFHLIGKDGFAVYDVELHKTYKEWQEAIKLYEKILPELEDGEMKQHAVIELAQLYNNTGEHEKALALALSAPEIEAARPFLKIKAFDGAHAVTAKSEALIETVRCSAELIVGIVLSDQTFPKQTAAKMLNNASDMIALICTDGNCGRLNGFLACIHMLRSYYHMLADEDNDAFSALDSALIYAKESDRLSKNGMIQYTSPLLHRVKVLTEPYASAFAKELPELWPWWDVPEKERVKAQLCADPRWDSWVRNTRE